MPAIFERYAALIFDLDGTLYLGEQLLPGAAELVQRVQETGRRAVFVSNNPTRTCRQYAEKLRKLGIAAQEEQIVNSSLALVRRMLERAPGARLHVIGEQPLISDLREAGFQIVQRAEEVDFVVASFDRSFDYPKLQLAFDAIRAGAGFVATNADRYCPVPGGGQPDAAAVIAAIEACTGVSVEEVVGKPSPFMARAALQTAAAPAEQCLMVGDRPETDIAMGLAAGMHTAFVLSGAGTRADLQRLQLQPTYTLAHVGELLNEPVAE